MLTKTYTGLWNKYRPVILKMMIDSGNGAQSYQLSGHEFLAFNQMKKATYTFSLAVAKGRVVSGARDSIVAQDLWEILQMSPKATELIANGGFNFSMDKQFVFHVRQETTTN